MSRISQDFINSVGYLYEEINIQQNDFLNEESQYYDEEASELVEDIIATISTSMVYEGYSAEGIIGFLADSSEESIIEKYLSFDENILTESTVSEDYIVEQIDILNEAIGSALKLLGRGVMAAAKPAARLIKTATKRAIGPGGRKAVAKAVTKVKDIAKGAKAALPRVAKGALLAGTGVLTGYAGAKLGGAGGDGKVGPKIVGPKIVGPKIVGPKSSSPSGGGESTPSGGGGGSSTPSSGSPKPSPSKSKAPTGETDMQKWARLHPKLAAKVKPGQSGYDEISATRTKPGPYEKQDQTPTTGNPEAKIDTKAVEADIKKEQERLNKKAKETATTKEAYEIVLEYLISTEQVETVDEAHYVMLEMDSETIGSIVEEYKNDLLAEEITEWVNELVEEGYDLSEYTWEDLAEYYVNEAKVDKYLDNKLKKSKSLGDDEMGRSMRKDIKMSQRRKRASVTPDTPRQRRLAQKLRDNRDANNDEGPLGYAARSEEK
jgi:hypothetical protein